MGNSRAYPVFRTTDAMEAWTQALRLKMPPIRAVCAGGRHDHRSYFFLPWFLTASIAAAAASGSR